MLVITFNRGIFNIRKEHEAPNHTFGIKTDGTIIGYKGKPVKRFPKGFKVSDFSLFFSNENENPTLDKKQRIILFSIINDSVSNVIMPFFERMINAGCINYRPTYYDDSRFQDKTFRQWLELARKYEEKYPNRVYNISVLLSFEKKLAYENDKNVIELLQYYPQDTVSSFYSCTDKDKWNRVAKWLTDENVYLMYQLRSASSSSLSYYFNEIFNLCNLLNIKTPTNKPLQNLVKLRKMYDNMKNQIITDTLQSHQSKKWEYEDDDFVVIVPETYEELRKEGESQHNCLTDYWLTGYGNDLPKGKQQRGVVFIREKNNPTKSYITCDFDIDTLIIKQFLMNCNQNPNTKNAKDFRNKYQKHLLTLR